MNITKQKVEVYYDIDKAKSDMYRHIDNGWRIHTCTMGCYESGFSVGERILVVYEKEIESWN